MINKRRNLAFLIIASLFLCFVLFITAQWFYVPRPQAGSFNGLLVREEGKEPIFLIWDGKRRHLKSGLLLDDYWTGKDWWDQIQVVSDVDDYTTQVGEPIEAGFGEGAPTQYIRDALVNAYKRMDDLKTGLDEFPGTYSPNLGFPDGKVEGVPYDGATHYYQPLDGGINPGGAGLEWNPNQNKAYAVYGAIFSKWEEMGFESSLLGLPTSDEREAGTSGAEGFDTTGRVQDFEHGHIHWHRNGKHEGKAFETHGAIDNVYENMGGTNSWLGFPVSDEKQDPSTGYPRSNFEGGYITRKNGEQYEAFRYSKDIKSIIEEHKKDSISLNVDGESLSIVKLDCRIDPESLECDSGRATVYLNSEGRPISDKILARKVGLIDLSRDLQERVGSERMISSSIERLDRRLMLHTLIKIGEVTQSVSASTIATIVRAYATQGVTLKKDIFSKSLDLVKSLVTSPNSFLSLLVRRDFNYAQKNYREALNIAQGSIDSYSEAEQYLDSLFTAFAHDFPARHVLDRIDSIEKSFRDDMVEFGSSVIDEIEDNKIEEALNTVNTMLDKVNQILSGWGYMKEKNNYKPYDGNLENSNIAKKRYDTRYTLKLANTVVTLLDETEPVVSITSDLPGEIDSTAVQLSWRGKDDKTGDENLEYYYSLNGPVKRSGWTSSETKSFTGLENGNYVFKVKAKDRAGNTGTSAEMNFGVKSGVRYDATFIKDVTIPDGTRIKELHSVNKVWRLKNTGIEDWSGCVWQFVGGDKIGGPDEVNVINAKPGESADISVELTPPAGSVGETLIGYWQLFTPNGNPFGPKCWVSVGIDRGTPKTSWTFDSDSEEGWVPNNSVASHAVRYDPNSGSKVLALDPSGKDPWVENRTNVFFESSSYNTVHIRMASNAPDGAGSVYFHRSGEGFNQDNSLDFSVANHSRSGSAPYCNYYVNLGNIWSDKITGLRVDPCANGDSKTDKDTVAIDYIKVKSVKRSTPSLDLVIKPDQNEFEPGSTQKKEVKIEGKGYTVKNYVRVTKPNGKKVWAFYPNDEPLQNDFDPSSPLSFSDTKRPLYNCTRIVSNFTWHWDTYTFNKKNQVGEWKWEYWVEDVNNPGEKLAQDSETYQVSQEDQSNNPPTANSDTYTVPKNSSDNPLDVLSNDSDPDGEPISLDAIVSSPDHGNASIDGDSINYTPGIDYTDSDSFTYRISDTEGNTDIGQVDITVEGGTTNVQLTIDDAHAAINQTATPKVTLSDAPDGLSNFNITFSVADTSVAEFTDASIPDKFSAGTHYVDVAEDGSWIRVAAGDFGSNIDPGATDIDLATLKVKIKAQSTVTVSVDSVEELLDNDGNSINADTSDTGKVGFIACPKVKGGEGPPKSNHGKSSLLDDVNGDGTTNTYDAFVLFKAKVKGGPVVTGKDHSHHFDFNEDSNTNTYDAFVLFKKIVTGDFQDSGTSSAAKTPASHKGTSGMGYRVVEVNLDHAPKGLVGYKLSAKVPDGNVETIDLVAFDGARVVEGLNSPEATFAAADFDQKVEPGSSEVTLARLKVSGNNPVELKPYWLDDDTGSSYDPNAVDFTLKQVDTTKVPLKLESISAHPNPLTDRNSISFTVNGENIAASRLKVFGLNGKTVHDSGFVPGNRVDWSLKDEQGVQVSNGIYLYTITAKGFDDELARSEVRQVLVLK